MIKRILNKVGIYKTYPQKLGNKTFRIPIHKGLGFANFQDSEPWMDDLLITFGSNETRFLDVGVNVGQTLLKWKAHFPLSVYTGFEPNTDCVNYVQDLIKENKLLNCTLYDYALDTEMISKNLYLSDRDKSDSSATIIENFRPNLTRKAIAIKTISLKILGLADFDLVKIDVEGAELYVLKSLFEVNQTAIIICEILPIYDHNNADRLNRQLEIEKLLRHHNYSIFRIVKSPTFGLLPLDKIGIHSNMEWCDYVFMSAERTKNYKMIIK